MHILTVNTVLTSFVMKLIRHPEKQGASSIKVLITTPRPPLSTTCIRCSSEIVDSSRLVVFGMWRKGWKGCGGALILLLLEHHWMMMGIKC